MIKFKINNKEYSASNEDTIWQVAKNNIKIFLIFVILMK